MKYYSDIKEREIMSYATTWMDFENVILSQEKDKSQIISFICGI